MTGVQAELHRLEVEAYCAVLRAMAPAPMDWVGIILPCPYLCLPA